MCGIFGVAGKGSLAEQDLYCLVEHAQQRGKDSSGLMRHDGQHYRVDRADFGVMRLWRQQGRPCGPLIFGHSRLVTNGQADNQPVMRDEVCVFHNGIIVNAEAVWPVLSEPRHLQIDTEVIAALTVQHLKEGQPLDELPARVLAACVGVMACALVLPRLGKIQCAIFFTGRIQIIYNNPGRKLFETGSCTVEVIPFGLYMHFFYKHIKSCCNCKQHNA